MSKFNKRDQAVLDWVKKNRPDCAGYVEQIFSKSYSNRHDDTSDALMMLMIFAFESGREFQKETNAEFNNPNIYL